MLLKDNLPWDIAIITHHVIMWLQKNNGNTTIISANSCECKLAIDPFAQWHEEGTSSSKE